MHIQIINFSLEGIGHEEYIEIANSVAPTFAALPGLVSKVWLSDEENNTYGGIYTWENRTDMENYNSSDLFAEALTNNPNFANLSVKDFGIIEEPGQITSM